MDYCGLNEFCAVFTMVYGGLSEFCTVFSMVFGGLNEFSTVFSMVYGGLSVFCTVFSMDYGGLSEFCAVFQWIMVVSVSSVSIWKWFLEGVGLLLRPFWIKWILNKVCLEIGFAAPGGGLLLRPVLVHFLYYCDLLGSNLRRKGLPLNWICISWGGV